MKTTLNNQLIRFGFFLGVFVCFSFTIQAQRVAWVIGNSDYEDGELPNPVNDARLVHDSLTSLGFKVKLDENLVNPAAFVESWIELEPQIQDAEVFLFYYAGHGIQVENENYLIPTHANLQDEYSAKRECFAIKELIDRYKRVADSTAFVVVLDACRVNPFEMKWSRSYGSGAGLAKVSPPTGTLIAYSTEYGTTASDGDGQYSDYALAFAQAIGKPGLSVQEAFQKVRKIVVESSNERQVPVEENKLTDQLVFRQLPDITKLEFSSLLDDFEQVLLGAFRENALLSRDTISIELVGVEESYQLLQHYFNRLDLTDSDLNESFQQLTLFRLLYHLQSTPYVDESTRFEKEIEVFLKVQKSLDANDRMLCMDYLKVNSLGQEDDYCTKDRIDSLRVGHPLLQFAAYSILLADLSEFPALEMVPPIRSGSFSNLQESFYLTEFILSFEAIIEQESLSQICENSSASQIINYLQQYLNFYEVGVTPEDNQLGAGYALWAMHQVSDLELSRGEAAMLDDFLASNSFTLLERYLRLPVNYDSAYATNFMEYKLNAVITYLMSTSNTFVADMQPAFKAFVDRELESSMSANSTSLFDLIELTDNLVEQGFTDLENTSLSKNDIADGILSSWKLWVRKFVSDPELNDLHVVLDRFLENQWYMVEDDFSASDLSEDVFRDLSAKHINLLRITNRVASCEYLNSIRRISMVFENENDFKLLLEAIDDAWAYLSLGDQEVFELYQTGGDYFGTIQCLSNEMLIIISQGLSSNLSCDSLNNLKTILESAITVIGQNVTSDQNALILAQLLVSYFELSEHFYSSNCNRSYSTDNSVLNYGIWNQKTSSILKGLDVEFNSHPEELYFENFALLYSESFTPEFLLDWEICHFRLRNAGRINVERFQDLTERFQKIQAGIKNKNDRANLEFALFYQLYSLIIEISSDIRNSEGSKIVSNQNINLALDLLSSFVKKGTSFDVKSAAQHVMALSLQQYYHVTGAREEGAKRIVDETLRSLEMNEDYEAIVQDCYYLLCEELSCSGQFEEAIRFRSNCLRDTTGYWDAADLHQFAQDDFIDHYHQHGLNDQIYMALMTAYDDVIITPSMADFYVEDRKYIDYLECQFTLPTVKSWPIIELQFDDGTSRVLYKDTSSIWMTEFLSAPLAFVSVASDPSYVSCHEGDLGLLSLNGSLLLNEGCFWERLIGSGSVRELVVKIPSTLLSENVSGIRLGFYVDARAPTAHTQDLRYLTFLSGASNDNWKGN